MVQLPSTTTQTSILSFLLWDMHRRLKLDRLPDWRVVMQITCSGEVTGRYWLLLETGDPSE